MLGRYALNFGAYVEASFRGGKTWTKFEDDFTNPYTNAKTKADYDSGAAFQKVWNGKTKSELSQNGVSVNPTTPTIGGNSGVGELGLQWGVTRAASLDFNLKGYVADQKGINGGISSKISFLGTSPAPKLSLKARKFS